MPADVSERPGDSKRGPSCAGSSLAFRDAPEIGRVMRARRFQAPCLACGPILWEPTEASKQRHLRTDLTPIGTFSTGPDHFESAEGAWREA